VGHFEGYHMGEFVGCVIGGIVGRPELGLDEGRVVGLFVGCPVGRVDGDDVG